MEMFAIIVIVVIVAVMWLANKKRQALQAARDQYNQCLEELKKYPANPERRQDTLAKGRHYANLNRDKKGVALFDEVALMNDINAACAGVAEVKSPSETTVADSIEDRLKRLAKLKESNLISEQEYDEKRRTILSEV